MSVLVGTTLTTFAMQQPEIWSSWLTHARAMKQDTPDVTFFAAIEMDARGYKPFELLIDRLAELNGGEDEYYGYLLDDGRVTVTSTNRLRHICFGWNLIIDRACTDMGISHILFLGADTSVPGDSISKLIELDHPLVGGHVPTYCLDGPMARERGGHKYAGMDVREHMNTTSFLMVRRDLFRTLRFRWDLDEGLSDDPALFKDAQEIYGIPTYVRHDLVGQHYPEVIPPVEHRGYDLTVERA